MMTEPLSIPAAVPEDYSRLAEIGRAAFEEDKRKYGEGPDIYENPSFLLELLQEGGGVVRKLVAGGQTVGVAITFHLEPGVRRLGCLCFAPEWQGMGYGAQAIRLLEEAYPDDTRWTLDTPADSEKNLRFYQKAGYRIVGNEETGGGPVLALMEKQR